MAQEAKELKVNEEAQSITKEATEEISQKIADNEVSITNITPH